MARDKITYDSYDRDVFDNPPRGPVGVHRGNRSAMARLAPFLIVILVAALCGLAVWMGISGEYKTLFGIKDTPAAAVAKADTSKDDKSAADSKADTAKKQDEAKKDADTQADASATAGADAQAKDQDTQDGQQQDAQPASTVNKDTQVLVVNGTTTSGYAGQKSDVLQTNGYTSVTASNPTGAMPSYTVVWYQNETDKATAEDVAATLGIANVEQVQGLGTPIAVMLMN